MTNLQRIKHTLQKKLQHHAEVVSYCVPNLWIASNPGELKTVAVNPYRFFLDAIESIEKSNQTIPKRGDGGDWSRDAVVYNMFVRTTCAFDHDQNGKLDLPTNADGFREVGTFMKAITLLPYIQRLGANTIHLLPITAIGQDGNKGTLGSPYAIKNPYKLDETLSEPALGLGPDVEFAAFVEVAHRLGMRVVAEFVFRTASKDSDWILEHPEWFYWIRADVPDRELSSTDESKYGLPIFTVPELQHIMAAVAQNRFDMLIPPHPIYQAMFTPPPLPENIIKENGRFIGILEDGTHVRIPGAFADWPPNDTQPPWGDVTYVKMYDHPNFNYMSYNTVRMYDARLARSEHANYTLSEKIIGIIPYFQKTFGIDGVMIDMGHALPMELKRRMVQTARAIDPDFAIWDENFAVTSKSREEGYNAVIGYCWTDHHHRDKFRNLLRRCEQEGFPIPFFATPESHNTPRATARRGSVVYSKAAWFIDNFLPAIPFIHSGFELGENYPINTGLDFSPEEIKLYPSNTLPLFCEYAYDWLRKDQFTEWIRKISLLRQKFSNLITDYYPGTFSLLDAGNDEIIAVLRTSQDGTIHLISIVNFDFFNRQHGVVSFGIPSLRLKDLLSGKIFEVRDARLHLLLEPGECILLTV